MKTSQQPIKLRYSQGIMMSAFALVRSARSSTRLLGCVALLAILLAQTGLAQKPSEAKVLVKNAADKKTDEATQKDTPDATEDKSDAKSDILALVGGDIITVTRETIRGGTILIEDGKITGLGNDIKIPDGARQIDVTGKILTPGFVAISMSGVGLVASSASGAKYEDSLDPFDRNVTLSLGVGITTGCLQIRSGGGNRGRRRNELGEGFPITERFPGLDPDAHQLAGATEVTERDFGEFIELCKCCGLPILPTEPITPTPPRPITPQKNVVVKMSYGRLDGMLVGQDVFLDVMPGSLSGALNQRQWRESLESARKYLVDQAAHEKASAAGKKERPPRKPVSDEILNLVQGKIALRISASSVTDLQDMLQLSQELDYKLVIAGAAEAWVVAEELAEANAAVTITPRQRRRAEFGHEDTTGTWIETPRVLEQSGVPFAITTLSDSISLGGLAGRDLTSLPLEAAFAVRGGASEREALEAITIAPATMMGLQERIGSLEVGKDADILILNGSPLDYRTYVETALVNGRVCYERGVARVLPVFER